MAARPKRFPATSATGKLQRSVRTALLALTTVDYRGIIDRGRQLREPSATTVRLNVQSNVNADEERLIRECREGRSESFAELVCRYQDRLFNTVYRLLDNAEDARDIVQEAFINAYQNLASFKGDARFFTWLYRIAVNSAITHKRKQRGALRLFQGADSGGVVETQDPSLASRPDYHLETVEEEQRVQQALNQLSAEHRAVLVMKDMDGEKYETMAEVLGVPIGTIRSRLHRARMELREVLLRQEQEKNP